ncbi:uncharacterized protein [Diabrotica undecimpunctata]|uniref:uncharacterized protein n=1 Tax=Diabrotica undecimpunctata TaxID=50387 RepID=UPI003B638154
MLQGAPPDTLGLAAQSGWMNSELFVEVLEHFIKQTNNSINNPFLLIYDNAECHISAKIVNRAREAAVFILTLPPHCSNKMQPLDLTVFGPFKSYYNKECDKWMLNNPGIPLTIYNIAEYPQQYS